VLDGEPCADLHVLHPALRDHREPPAPQPLRLGAGVRDGTDVYFAKGSTTPAVQTSTG
jgi:hypothetical protein